MDCNKCYHKDVCAGFEVTQNDCKNFKNSENVIELPCKVGDIIYQIDFDGKIAERKVTAIILGEFGLSYEFWIDWFGIYRTSPKEKVFFTFVEAEKALNKIKPQNNYFMNRFMEVK